MNKDFKIETYLTILPNKIEIHSFDINELKVIYKDEYKFKNAESNLEYDLINKFLEDNIFKIEKLVGQFIKNIYLIIENKELLVLSIGVKKNYDEYLNKKNLEILLTEAKDLFKENYQEFKLMHMIINNYILNEKSYNEFIDKLNVNKVCLELNFISIPINLSNEIEKILEKFQIRIIKYIDYKYINKIFEESEIQLPEMANRIQNHFNKNEVILIPKNLKKVGFFEKFFQLFS